jgi:hypothetical protein
LAVKREKREVKKIQTAFALYDSILAAEVPNAASRLRIDRLTNRGVLVVLATDSSTVYDVNIRLACGLRDKIIDQSKGAVRKVVVKFGSPLS